MKRLMLLLGVGVFGFAAGAVLVSRQLGVRHDRAFAAQRAAWETEKADLEAALGPVERPAIVVAPAVTAPKHALHKPSADEIIEKLKAVRIVPGQGAPVRQAIVLLNDLAQLGPDALPAIRQFLALNQDVDYDPSGKGVRDIKALTDSTVPGSLRLALFDVVRQIGGDGPEKLLLDVLANTGRGVEVAYIARVLEQMAPGKYLDLVLTAARDLLAKGAPVSNSALDRFHRDYLYDILKSNRDNSYVATAQTQLIQPDGKVDRSALRYLQQALGPQSIPLAAQAYQDPRLAQPDRESLARVGLSFVGIDPQGAQMFHSSIFDQSLSLDRRRELIHDLDQDGLINDKAPTSRDVQVIQNRVQLIQNYLQQDYIQRDPALTAAFQKANKDLHKLLDRAATAGAAPASIK